MSVDLRQVVRNLVRRPGSTSVVVLTLALGIGANTAIFSVVNSLLLRPLPFPDSERLVRVYHSAPGLNVPDDIGLSDATYFFFRDSGVLEDLALYETGAANLATGDAPERVESVSVSHSLFETLGVAPALGRVFSPDDELPGAPLVIVLSDGLWRRGFGARGDVVGKTVLMDGVRVEIVGVMPARFSFPGPEVELWGPMRLDPGSTDLGSLGTASVGRLRPDLSAEATEAQLAARIDDVVEAFPDQEAAPILDRAGFAVHLRDLRDTYVADLRDTLWVLMGSVGFILLIACANVANLFLVRAEGRERELAVRSALGAERRHLVAGFLAESTILGFLAGLAGLLLAYGSLRGVLRYEPQRLPRLEELTIDGIVLGFNFAVALIAGTLFGAVPALRYRAAWLATALREGGRSQTAARGRLQARNVLVGFQVAVALVLLVGSGLMVRSYRSLAAVEPGFAADNVLTFRLALNPNDYPGDAAPASFIRRALDEIAGVAGVESAGAVSQLPLAAGSGSGRGVMIEDHPLGPDDLPPVHFFKFASAGYFETMRIPLIAGRTFERPDHEERRASVIVNESFARRYWPDGDVVGKRLQFGGGGEPDAEAWYTIVGVVGDVRDMRLEEEPRELMYLPLLFREEGGWEVRNVGVAARTAVSPMSVARPIGQRIRDLDPNLPIADVQTMADRMASALVRKSFTMTLLLAGSAAALLIGAVGIYGVISYVVGQQTREIGVRVALGARAAEIGWMVLRRSLKVTLAGVAVGVVGATLLTRLMRAMLFGVSPLDPLTFVAVIVVLTAVAALAAWAPARRATRVDPLEALRSE